MPRYAGYLHRAGKLTPARAIRPFTVEVVSDDARNARAICSAERDIVRISDSLLRSVISNASEAGGWRMSALAEYAQKPLSQLTDLGFYQVSRSPGVKTTRLHIPGLGEEIETSAVSNAPDPAEISNMLERIDAEYLKVALWLLGHEVYHLWAQDCSDEGQVATREDERSADLLGATMILCGYQIGYGHSTSFVNHMRRGRSAEDIVRNVYSEARFDHLRAGTPQYEPLEERLDRIRARMPDALRLMVRQPIDFLEFPNGELGAVLVEGLDPPC